MKQATQNNKQQQTKNNKTNKTKQQTIKTNNDN